MPVGTRTAAADTESQDHSHKHDQGQAAVRATDSSTRRSGSGHSDENQGQAAEGSADSSSRRSGSGHSDENQDRASRGSRGSHGTPSDKTKVGSASGSVKQADNQGHIAAEHTERGIGKGTTSAAVGPLPVIGSDIAEAGHQSKQGPHGSVPQRSHSGTKPGALRSDEPRSSKPSLKAPSEEHLQPHRGVQQRNQRKPIGIIALLMYNFVVIAAVLVTIVLFTKSAPTAKDTCSTAECREYTSLLASSINASVSPCHSFTRFVCGGWERGQALSVREMLHQRAQDHMTRRVQAIQVPPSGQNSIQRAAAVYRSCQHVLSGYSDRLTEVKRALEGAGITWPHIQDHPNVLRTLMATSLNLAWDTIAHVVPMRSGNRTTLMVNPGRLFYRIIEQATYSASDSAFKAYFRTLRKSFGHGRSDSNAVSLEETLEVHKMVAGSLLPNYYVRATAPAPLAMPPGIGLSNTDWLSILEQLGYNKTSQVDLVSTSPYFINSFFDIWQRKGDRYTHILASWSTVQVAALFANKRLIVNYYGGNEWVASARYGAFCMSLAYLFSHNALYGSHESELDRNKTRKGAERLIQSVVDAFRRRLPKWRHFTKDVTVVANWTALYSSGVNFDNTRDQALANRALDMSDSLVENWRKLSLLPGSPVDEEIARSISSLRLSAPFADQRTFRLPPLSTSFPVFDVRLHSAANYGGLGVQVASSLAWLLTTAYAHDSRTAGTITNLSACVEENPSRGFDVDSPLSQAIAAGALVDAYEAEASVKHMPSPLVGSYSGTQLFFMALCFTSCRVGASSYSESVCDLPMRQVKEFAGAFGCAPGTPLNPTERCEVP